MRQKSSFKRVVNFNTPQPQRHIATPALALSSGCRSDHEHGCEPGHRVRRERRSGLQVCPAFQVQRLVGRQHRHGCKRGGKRERHSEDERVFHRAGGTGDDRCGPVAWGPKVDAILCVAGGWAGGNCSSKDFYKNSDLMWKQSVWTSTISSHLAALHLKPGGLLTLAGAKAALSGTGGMAGYGMAKAAVHQLCQSLAAKNSGMPSEAAAVAVLPVTLDTPMNRKFMPNADFSSWTPLEYIAEMFFNWATGKDRPASGSLMQLLTSGGQTQAVATQ
ncbi:hypothetical protein Q5P01_008671 [Channa striata]|uniref:Dihydropteridine reductase n=1 Tax=Channa striata TaxID=64152 RepID=A0AA88SSX2_CHASR|nr:hypothetical protein Q5P01_008671 [Channa striata]